LATDPKKKDLFAKLAEHFKVLAREVEKAKEDLGSAIAPKTDKPSQPNENKV